MPTVCRAVASSAAPASTCQLICNTRCQCGKGEEEGHAYLVSSLEIPAAAALAKGLSSFNRNETETKLKLD